MPSLRAVSLLLVLLAAPAPAALAQGGAVVRVEVTDRDARPSDASVTLRPHEGGGASYDCVTRNGTCEIRGVAPGQYVVTATPTGQGRPPVPRVVPVPAAVATVEVRVRLL